jgi:hypothetical protein
MDYDIPLSREQVVSAYGENTICALDALESTDGASELPREYRTSVTVADGRLVALRYGTSPESDIPDHYVLEFVS